MKWLKYLLHKPSSTEDKPALWWFILSITQLNSHFSIASFMAATAVNTEKLKQMASKKNINTKHSELSFQNKLHYRDIRKTKHCFTVWPHKPRPPRQISRQLKLANHKSRSRQWNSTKLYLTSSNSELCEVLQTFDIHNDNNEELLHLGWPESKAVVKKFWTTWSKCDHRKHFMQIASQAIWQSRWLHRVVNKVCFLFFKDVPLDIQAVILTFSSVPIQFESNSPYNLIVLVCLFNPPGTLCL